MKDPTGWEKFSQEMKKLDEPSRAIAMTYMQGLADGRKIAESKLRQKKKKKTG